VRRENVAADVKQQVDSPERLKLMRDEICKADTGAIDL